MDKKLIIEKTKEYIKETLMGDSSGHDFWHIFRVWTMAKRIAKEEKADTFIAELGALLHDIADWKFYDGNEEIGPKKAGEWLESLNVDESVIKSVQKIVRTVSFKGAGVSVERNSLEEKIVHDADKLDAIGAIGIARTFAYGGSKGGMMHDPLKKPVMHQSFEEYKKSQSPTINHFYEKLLLLKDQMYTKTGKNMAIHRHAFMEKFLKEFYLEWDGKL